MRNAPSRIDTIEDHFRDRNAEYVAVKQRYEEIEADQRSRKIELDALAESRKKYMDALMQVKNQREYAAVLKELDIVKAQIETHEEAVIKDMEENWCGNIVRDVPRNPQLSAVPRGKLLQVGLQEIPAQHRPR